MNDYEDMSPWAVHFTSARMATAAPEASAARGTRRWVEERLREIRGPDDGYDNIMSVLWDGHVEAFAEPHGAGKVVPEVAQAHRSAALSEIPLHLLDRIVASRTRYGIGFSQDFLLRQGGGRVWYVESGSALALVVQEQVDARVSVSVDTNDPFWRMTPFIDFPDTSHPFTDWRWEREWRVPGGLRFQPDDVAFLFIPEHNHDAARQFFTDHQAAHTGPAYLCQYIDVTWDRDRILAQLEALPRPATPSPSALYDPMDDILDDDLHRP